MMRANRGSKRNFWISFLFYLFFLNFILEVVIGIISIGQSLLSPDMISIMNTGYSYRYNMLIGYGEVKFEDMPFYHTIENNAIFVLSAGVSYIISNSIPFLAIMIYGRKILRIINNFYTPFSPDMPAYIRNIGIIFILMGFFGKLIRQLLLGFFNFHKLYFHNPLELQWIFIGLLIIVLSDIFRRGVELQRNEDETL